MKFIRPKKGTPEHEEVCAIMRGSGMRGGDYKGETSDYQAALKKWNISKGWRETHIWQAPHKGRQFLKASPEYLEVIQEMKGNRESLRNNWLALYRRLKANTRFNKESLQDNYVRTLNAIERKTSDDRKIAEHMMKWLEARREGHIKQFGVDPLAGEEAAVPMAAPAPEPQPAAEAPASIKIDSSFAKSKERRSVLGATMPSNHELYTTMLSLYDFYLTKLKKDGELTAAEVSERRKELNEKQRELMGEVADETQRVLKLKSWVLSKVPKPVREAFKEREEAQNRGEAPVVATAAQPNKKATIKLRPVDDMKTMAVLIELNVLSGREDLAKRVEAGESRHTPPESGTSIGDKREYLKELRRQVFGKEAGVVEKKPQYKIREGSIDIGPGSL